MKEKDDHFETRADAFIEAVSSLSMPEGINIKATNLTTSSIRDALDPDIDPEIQHLLFAESKLAIEEALTQNSVLVFIVGNSDSQVGTLKEVVDNIASDLGADLPENSGKVKPTPPGINFSHQASPLYIFK